MPAPLDLKTVLEELEPTAPGSSRDDGDARPGGRRGQRQAGRRPPHHRPAHGPDPLPARPGDHPGSRGTAPRRPAAQAGHLRRPERRQQDAARHRSRPGARPLPGVPGDHRVPGGALPRRQRTDPPGPVHRAAQRSGDADPHRSGAGPGPVPALPGREHGTRRRLAPQSLAPARPGLVPQRHRDPAVRNRSRTGPRVLPARWGSCGNSPRRSPGISRPHTTWPPL